MFRVRFCQVWCRISCFYFGVCCVLYCVESIECGTREQQIHRRVVPGKLSLLFFLLNFLSDGQTQKSHGNNVAHDARRLINAVRATFLASAVCSSADQSIHGPTNLRSYCTVVERTIVPFGDFGLNY